MTETDLIEPFEGYCSVFFTDSGLMIGAATRNFAFPETVLLAENEINAAAIQAIIEMCKRHLPKGSIEVARAAMVHRLEQSGFRSERDMVKNGARTSVMFRPEHGVSLLRSYLPTPSSKKWKHSIVDLEWETSTSSNLITALSDLMNAEIETLTTL